MRQTRITDINHVNQPGRAGRRRQSGDDTAGVLPGHAGPLAVALHGGFPPAFLLRPGVVRDPHVVLVGVLTGPGVGVVHRWGGLPGSQTLRPGDTVTTRHYGRCEVMSYL